MENIPNAVILGFRNKICIDSVSICKKDILKCGIWFRIKYEIIMDVRVLIYLLKKLIFVSQYF